MQKTKYYLSVFIILLLLGCGSKHDSDYIPYDLTGFDIYLYDDEKAPDGDYYAGSITCNYSDRNNGLSRARKLAYNKATELKFNTNNRYYIFCTKTKKSSCVTKVR